MADLNFAFTANNAGFMRTLNQVTAGMRDAAQLIEAEGGSIDRVISQIRNGLATIGVGWGLKEIAGQVANTRGEFQQLEVAFKTMLGSAEEANTLMNQLVRTAAITPFDLQGVANGAKSLMAYGIEAKDVNQTLIQLGDIAAGLSIPLNDLVYLYGTTMVQGRMFTQDLRQFQGRGIPIADELAKQFGVAKEKVGELVTAGKVGAKEFKAAIDAMTAEGSQFGGLMEAQSKTISGQISNIEDAVAVMFNEIGKSSEGAIDVALGGVSQLVEHWQQVLIILGDVAAAYGVQKAALALDAGFTAAAANYGYDAEIAQLKALIPIKEEEQKSSLQQAVASGQLTQAKADEVLALREEAKAQLDVLVSKETAAKAEEAAAIASLEAADRKVLALQNEKDSWLDLYNEAINAGDAETAQAIATEIAASEVSIKEAADQALVLAEEARTASTNASAASEARESLATQINTAQTAANTTAIGILTVAKEKLTAATLKFNAAVAANQIAIITGLIIAFGYAAYKAATYETDLSKALKAADESAAKQQASMRQEISTLDGLEKKIKQAKKGTEEWKSAKNEIVSQYGKYFDKLDDEISRVGDLTTTYDKLTKAVRISAAARAMQDYRAEFDSGEDINDALKDLQDKLDKPLDFYKDGKLLKSTVISGALREQVLRYAYDYASGSDVNIPDKIKEILRAAKFDTDYGYDPTTGQRLGTGKGLGARRKSLDYIQGEKKIAERYGTTIDEIDGIKPFKPEELKTTDKAYWETKKKDATLRLEALSDIAAKGKEGDKIRKEIAEYNKKLKSFDDGSKKQTGQTAEQRASKISEEHQQVIDLMKRQAEEKAKLEIDYERQRWQNRIDLMEEGEAKVLEQMRLDQTKERDALKEQEARAIQAEIQRQKALFDAKEDEKAARTKGYGKQVFDQTKDVDLSQIDVIKERYAKLNEDLQKQQEKANVDRLKSAKEAMNAYLEAFGTYEQKRKAIEEKYDKQYAEAGTHGERLMALANKNKATADLDFSQWSESGDMSLAFGDVSKLSKDTISQLIADMEKYRTEVLKTFDIENIRKFDETLANLRTAEVDDSFFGDPDGLLEGLRERLVLQKQIYDEEQKQTALVEQQKQLKEELSALESSMLAGSLNTSAVGPDGEKVEQPAISEDDVKRADELRVKLGQVQKLLDNSSRNSKQLNSQLKQFGKVKFADIKKFSNNLLKAGRNAASLASVFSDDVADAITQGVDSMEVMVDSIDTISSSFNALAKSTANAVKDAANAGKSAVDAAGDGMKATAASTATSLSTMEKASAILAIIGAAIQLATMMVSLFSSDKKHEKRIKQLQDQIDALQISYDKLGRAIDNAYGSDASNLIEQQDRLLRQQKVLIRQQMAEEEAKKKTDDDKIKQYKEQLEEIDQILEDNKSKAKEAIIGEDIKSAISEFASAYAEAWQDGSNAASASMKAVKSIVTSALNELLKQRIQPTAQKFYDALADAMKGGVLTEAELKALDRLKAELDSIAAKEEAQFKMLLDRYRTLEEIQEDLTDTTFDSVRDDFKSLLSDMESSSADFSDSFTDMLRNALIEGLMSAKYDKMLQEWYAEFADKMSDQRLTDAERDFLRQKYQAIVDAGIADRNAINEIVGQGAFAQSPSQGGFAAMDQDTASELNGRFTALVELQASSNTLLSDSNALSRDILLAIQSLNNVSQVTTGENTTLLAIKDMMFLSTGYLEDIAAYSKRLVSIDSGIDNMRKTLENKL